MRTIIEEFPNTHFDTLALFVVQLQNSSIRYNLCHMNDEVKVIGKIDGNKLALED
jgi:hypothetical protein